MSTHHFKIHNFNVDISLYRNEIIYDVDFSTNRVARVNIAEEEGKKASLISSESSSTDFKADYIDRCITTALTKVKQKLTFAKPSLTTQPSLDSSQSVSESANNEIAPNDQLFKLSFTFEEGWQGTPQVLCDLIHSYVVNSVLADWFQLTLPAISAEYVGKANADLRSIAHEGRSVILVPVPGFYL